MSSGPEVEIFQGCFDLAPSEQSAYLDRMCRNDDGLRARIERLLAAHQRAERATIQPLQVFAGDDMEAIGPYRLVRVLGEGGMGVVYEAEQREPVERRVALKIVKLGMDTRQVITRFMAERQALAAMDHPYVAKVFDAGTTASGRPYFVMELVRGEPLHEYCGRAELSIPDRIALFIRVCQAVQHAHQKGVVHRDLKPSNLLVSDGEGGPTPRVIDFGIAKAIDETGSHARTEITRAGQALGTPAYMSPEQAAHADIDTRADIYSLGVILYELLTGTLPVDPRAIGQDVFLARLASGTLDVARPSTTQALSRWRRPHSARIADDLDWIVMKALESDRARRYETALSLAEDLTRFMRDEPVAARPPNVSYRLAKYVRRHRTGVVASALAGLAIVGGATAAGVGLVRATRAEARAIEEAESAREVSEFLAGLFSAADPNQRAATLRDVLDRGIRRLDTELAGQPAVQAQLFATLSHVYESLGVYANAASLAEKALVLEGGREETLETAKTARSLGRARLALGEFDAARKAFERALAIRTRLLGENNLAVAELLNELGGLHGQLEHYDEAVAAHSRALEIQRRVGGPQHLSVSSSLRGLAIVYARTKDVDRALELDRQVLAIYENTYPKDHPMIGSGIHSVAVDLKDLNRLDEAQIATERALDIRTRALGPDHPQVAFTHHLMGAVLEARNKPREALASYHEALRIREKALGPDNPRTADVVSALGHLHLQLGDVAEARALLERAVRIYDKAYGPAHSKTIEGRKQLAIANDLALRVRQ